MALQLRSARWVVARPAGRIPGRAAVVTGLVSVTAGALLLLASLAPMWMGAAASPLNGSVAGAVTSIAHLAPPLPPLGTAAGDRGPSVGIVYDGPVNGVAFQLIVPKVGYNATVYEGVTTADLERGPGHYPDSAWPGEPGNVAVAAHNVYWLAFNRLAAGDEVQIRTRHHLYTYAITGSKVVSPDDRTVLAQTPEHLLTLTTCYPLWAGALATQRLIFTAREV